MLLSRNAVSCDLDRDPTFCASTLPCLKSISVGMPRMPYFFGISWFSSTLTLATLSLRILLGDLVEHGGDRLARAAPFGPVVDQHRDLGFKHLGLESGVVDVMDEFV